MSAHLANKPTFIKYYTGNTKFNEEFYVSGATQAIKTSVDLPHFFQTIQTVIYKYIDDVQSDTPLDPENYKWDFYTALGIPPRSLYYHFNDSNQGYEATKIRGRKAYDFTQAIKTVFGTLNYFSKIQNAFTDPGEHGFLRFLQRGHAQQVLWEIFIKGTRVESVTMFSDGRQVDRRSYKIHLCPKPEYLLYTVCRLFTIMKQNPIFHKKLILGKFLLAPRDSNPTEDNTKLVELNGGAAPTIVIYWNSDNEILKETLEVLLREFKDDEPTIGAMTADYRYRVLPFNVRLNSLLFYAQGDRIQKLAARNKFRNESQSASVKQFFMPDWVADMMSKCSGANSERIANLSMQLLGKNICTPEMHETLANPNCLDDICWMATDAAHILDPRTLSTFQIEPESSGDIEEADTSANNLVVNPDLGGPGVNVAVGGKRTRREKKRANRKKTKRNQNRKSRAI